jgi:hypothetical protein
VAEMLLMGASVDERSVQAQVLNTKASQQFLRSLFIISLYQQREIKMGRKLAKDREMKII